MSGIPTITAYRVPAKDAMPTNTADWKPDPLRAVLLVHDMQQYFLRFLPEALRDDVVRNTATLRGRAIVRSVPVAYTQQPGNMTEQQRGLLADFWGGGMSSAPEDRDVVPELVPAADDWLVTKWRYSAFFSSDLLDRMRQAGRDQLVLCGVFAHIGVLATAIDAYANDIQAFLVGDAVGDFSEAEHLMALDYAARRCGMAVLTEEVFT